MRYRDERMTTGFFRGYCLYYLLYDLRVAQLNKTENISPLVYHVEKLFPVFWYTLPLATSQTKSVCEQSAPVGAFSRISITCANTNYTDVPELPHPRGRGRSHS